MAYTVTLDLMIKIISLMTSINDDQFTECLLIVSLTCTINLGITENGCYAINMLVIWRNKLHIY